MGLLTREKPQLKPNPDIIINFMSDFQGDGHAILVSNSDDYKVDDQYVHPRRTYYGYPRTVDQNLEEADQKKILGTKLPLIVPSGFHETIGKGMWDKYRGITFLYPSHEQDLPYIFKQGEYSHHALGIMRKRLKLDFIKMIQQQDLEASKLIEQTVSLYSLGVKKLIEDFSSDLRNIKNVLDTKKQLEFEPEKI